MPPMVAREDVEMSTGNHRPCGLSWRFKSSSTMPGSTVQRARLTSRSRIRVRYLEQSTTKDSPTVCPACDVPPPRASTLAFSDRAIAIARSEKASVLARGGGTSQAGQTVGESLVVDCSKYLTRILDLDVK